MVKYRCNKCGREFPNKTPHKCLTGFQKRHLTYTRVYEDKPLFEEVDSNILELLKLIPKEEQQRVFSWRYSEYCPAPNKDIGFLGFIETYKHLSQMIPKHWTIIDIGAYGNAQSYYFTEHKKYIAVEPSCSDGRGIPMFQPANCEIFRCTGQQFVAHILPRLRLDLDTTFVVMNYVPSSECSEVIRKTFPNLYIYYPCMDIDEVSHQMINNMELSIKEKKQLITRFEILKTMFDNSKQSCSFEEYALANWDNVDMNYFETIG